MQKRKKWRPWPLKKKPRPSTPAQLLASMALQKGWNRTELKEYMKQDCDSRFTKKVLERFDDMQSKGYIPFD